MESYGPQRQTSWEKIDHCDVRVVFSDLNNNVFLRNVGVGGESKCLFSKEKL